MGEALLMNHKRKKKPEYKYYDTYTTIGATETLDDAAYNEAGYFGTVPASELFTGAELALETGITQGTLYNNESDWLKYYIDGKIIFTPQTFIRSAISWETINKAGCVDGIKIITKNNVNFKVRLIKGALTNPSMYSNGDRGAIGSEWNRLIHPVHIRSATPWVEAYVDSDTPSWASFSDADLKISSSTGGRNICQETIDGDSSRVVRRGGTGSPAVMNIGIVSKTDTSAYNGWRPVLEVIPPEELEGGI